MGKAPTTEKHALAVKATTKKKPRYYKGGIDKKLKAVNKELQSKAVQFHHVKRYAEGGKTVASNCVAVVPPHELNGINTIYPDPLTPRLCALLPGLAVDPVSGPSG